MLKALYRRVERYSRPGASERMKGLVKRVKTDELRLVSISENELASGAILMPPFRNGYPY